MTRATKTYEERILKMDQKEQELSEKLRQYQAKKKQLERQKREQDRKKRTKRLIECGAVAESVLGRPLVDGDATRLMNFLNLQERNGNYYTRAMGPGDTEFGKAESEKAEKPDDETGTNEMDRM